MVRPVTWTPGRKARFAEAYADLSVPVKDICQRFGVTLHAAHQQASEMGVHRAPPRPGNGRKKRYVRAHFQNSGSVRSWRRRCACGVVFTAHHVDELDCGSCG